MKHILRSHWGKVVLITFSVFFGILSVSLVVGLKVSGMFDALGALHEREVRSKELGLIATSEELAAAYYVAPSENGGPAFDRLLRTFKKTVREDTEQKKYGEFDVWPQSRTRRVSDSVVINNRLLVNDFWSKADPILKAKHVRFNFDFSAGWGADISEISPVRDAFTRTLGDAYWLALAGRFKEADEQFAKTDQLRKVAQDNYADELGLTFEQGVIKRQLRVLTTLSEKGYLKGPLLLRAQTVLKAEPNLEHVPFTLKVRLHNDLQLATTNDIRALAANMGFKPEDSGGPLWIRLQPYRIFQNAWKSSSFAAALRANEMTQGQTLHFAEEYGAIREKADDERFKDGLVTALPWERLASWQGVGPSELPDIRAALKLAMSQHLHN